VADEQTTPAPRRFRKVETVREQAEKASAREEKGYERPRSVFWRGFTAPIRALGRALKKLGHLPPLRQIGHGLRWFARLRVVRFIAKILLLPYFYNSWRELRQVTWPTRRESRRLTTAVVLFALVFGLLIALVDYGLDKLFKQVLLK